MNLAQIEKELMRLINVKEAEILKHKAFLDECALQASELKRQKGILMKSLDLDRIKIAESILYVKGLKDEFDERCTLRAIKDIASGGNGIKEYYHGVKDYAHFIHQGSSHKYGYGPKHGTIVYSIGLRKPGYEMTDAETEDCLYYLNLLLDEDIRQTIAGGVRE